MKFNTPLRYPKGRSNILSFFKIIFAQNDLLGGHYVEPYAGSAGIALNLLTQGYVSRVHLNDANPAIYAFWHSVINQPEEFCKAIHDIKITTEEWRRQQDILSFPENHSALEVGFSIFFLNRINRLGILHGDVTDEKSHSSHWKFDARFNKLNLIRGIEWVALHRSLIRLYNQDATDLIKTVLPALPDKTLIYFDVPYQTGERCLQKDRDFQNNRASLAELIKKNVLQHWMVSYPNNPGIMEMYKGYPAIIYNICNNVRNHPKDSEIMIFSNRLVIPDWKNPSNLKTA
ncbi:DNA adenine methylase [Nitrosomonas oligotropha]|uniref:DNA adenine methylase n=1 Tax=Nitrosomonas oligotropha TaxID=42354 RepID=UPI00136FD3FC|nr:DNA adenine methylase [Nitrosomonas oligotropha]